MNKLTTFIDKNRSSIFIGAGLASMLSGSVIGMIVTPAAVEKLKEEEEKQPLTFWGKVKILAKYYAIPGTLIAGGTGLVIGGHCVDKKAQAALATVASMSEAALGEYKGKLKELVGEEKAKEVEKEIDEKKLETKIAAEPTPYIYETGHGSYLCYDSFCDRFFRSSKEYIMAAQNDCNKEMLDSMGYCALNELYFRIGLRDCEAGDMLGYNVDNGLIDIDCSDYGPGINGEPCLIMRVKKNLVTVF